MKATLVVSAGVIDNGRLLMVQEGKEHCRGLWGLPGGRVEDGEPITDAIVREVKEETGLDARIVGISRVLRYVSQLGFHTVRWNFIIEPIGGTLRADGSEIIDARWMTYTEIDSMSDVSLRTPKIARQIINDLRNGFSFPLDLLFDSP